MRHGESFDCLKANVKTEQISSNAIHLVGIKRLFYSPGASCTKTCIEPVLKPGTSIILEKSDV